MPSLAMKFKLKDAGRRPRGGRPIEYCLVKEADAIRFADKSMMSTNDAGLIKLWRLRWHIIVKEQYLVRSYLSFRDSI